MEIITGKQLSAQKIVIYGPEGIGKSTFAAKFPNALFIDTEGSTKHMNVARTPKPSSWQMLLDQVQYVKQHPTSFQTLVIDTADWAEQLCLTSICAKHQKQGIEDFGYGKGYIYLAEEFGRLLNKLEELVDMCINVVITAHAKMRKFEQPDEMGAYDRWELKLQKQTGPLLKEWADMVLFANYKTTVINVDGQGAKTGKNKAQGGKRVMFTTHHPCWDAKNRHDFPPELPFEYERIMHCLPGVVPIEQATKVEPQHDPAPPEKTTTEMLEEEGFSEIKEPEQQIMSVSEQPQSPPAEKISLPKYIPKALADLMIANDVTENEIQDVVAKKGYYPANTRIDKYDPQFIQGVLVGAWPQVFATIDAERVPF